MSDTRSEVVEALFEQALGRKPEERDRFLQAKCAGDPDLLKAVEQLFRLQDSVVADPVTEAPEPAPSGIGPGDPYVGKDLGAYRITRRLEQGGMGNVYLGARSIDFRQVVAVKVLRQGMDSEEFQRRFRNEIQILAALRKHQSIAALLDAGTTEDGLPYFVMEYVEGEPLGSYCNHHSHTIRERVELFRKVCDAVHFAHQHMIIHRDLKMSNILVRTDDVPKLIDFGIAKLTVPELGDQTMVPTLVGQRLMTLKYASPEQVRGDPLTTASDVYSLGVILYELLTGRSPYNLNERPGENHVEIICEEEPLAPSAAVKPASASATPDGRDPRIELTDTCRMRRTTPKRLRKSLTGDLDSIVLKAMLKEPQRRYSTAEDLSDDLKRFLDGLPVEARPIGSVQKAGRWCLRNPLPAALLVSVLLTFAGGLWQLSRLADQLVQSTAIEGAALEAEVLSVVQDFYSKVVAQKVRDTVPVTHLYKSVEGAIPVPATFTIDLGDHIRKSQVTGMFARLYSGHPFAQRKDGGPRDGFEVAALERLRKDPTEPFYRFESYEGKPALRYATARIMKESCVNCHNSHPDSPKTNWEIGEVRGVLEIIRPLALDITRIHKGLSKTFLYMLGISFLLLGFAVFFLRRGETR